MKRPIARLSLLAVLALLLALALAASALGSVGGAARGAQSWGSGAGLAGVTSAELQAASPAAIAKRILGHAPRGLAKTVVLRGEMLVANDRNYPPQSYVDRETGKLVGFDVDVAKRVARILGLTVVWKHPAWATVVAGQWHGRFDVSIGSMSVTPARKKVVSFTGPYYFDEGQVFVTTGGTLITGPADLNGKTVGVGAHTTCYDYLKKNTDAIVKTYGTDLDAVPDLLNGTLDFWMTHPVTGHEAILEGKALEFSGKPLYYGDIAIAVKKDESDWRALLNYTVKQMHRDGSLSAMSTKWYSGLDLTVKQEPTSHAEPILSPARQSRR
jgi:polar amino acid transport system substrate-binding protein